MTSPYRPMPDAHMRGFNLALCKRLGIDPEMVSEDFLVNWSTIGGEEFVKVRVSFAAYLPAEEILAMFNEAGGSGR